jgi:hypothetical protein
MADLPEDVPPQLVIRIRAGLMQVHSKKLEGLSTEDCLRQSYDVCASACYNALAPLTDDLLREQIPAWIFHWCVEKQWIIYPLERGVIRVMSLSDPWISPTEKIPDAELIVSIGKYKVDPDTKNDLLKRLESRIVHWQAEALKLEEKDHPTVPLRAAPITQVASFDVIGPGGNADFWSKLAEQFERVDDPRDSVRAYWCLMPDGQPTRWDVRALRNETLGQRDTLEALCRTGGYRLNPTEDSLYAWLEELRKRGMAEDLSGTETMKDKREERVEMQTGVARSLKNASSRLARVLQSETIEHGRDSRPTKPRQEHLRDEKPIDHEPSAAANSANPSANIPEQRNHLVENFKAKAREAGIKVTDEMIAKAANPGKWNTRTPVTWWKRNDPKSKPAYDTLIRKLLGKEPSSIWPSKNQK